MYKIELRIVCRHCMTRLWLFTSCIFPRLGLASSAFVMFLLYSGTTFSGISEELKTARTQLRSALNLLERTGTHIFDFIAKIRCPQQYYRWYKFRQAYRLMSLVKLSACVIDNPRTLETNIDKSARDLDSASANVLCYSSK